MHQYVDPNAIKPGEGSSEHKLVARAFAIGQTLIALGVVVVLTGAYLSRMTSVIAGIGLLVVGGHVLSFGVHSYSRARGHVKAAAVAPPPVEVGSRGI